MWKFISYEIKYWIRKPMTWIFLFITTFFTAFMMGNQEVTVGGTVGSVYKNAPYAIEVFYGVFSILLLIMMTAYMNATAIRDFEYNMYQFIFSSPIKKRDYFFGKFLGAAIISLIPMTGLSIGALLSPYLAAICPESFGMAPPERFGPVVWSAHLNGILVFALPNIIIAGVFIYALALKFRSSIVSFISIILLIVLYNVSGGLSRDIKKEWLASLLDPFGMKALDIMTKYITVAEKNTAPVGLEGPLLINRLAWVALSLVILFAAYYTFSFSKVKEKGKSKKHSARGSPGNYLSGICTICRKQVFYCHIVQAYKL